MPSLSRIVVGAPLLVFCLVLLFALAGCNAYKNTVTSARDCELVCTDCGDFEFKCGSKGSASETQSRVPQ